MAADRPIRIPDDLPVLPPGGCLPAGGGRVVPGVLFSLVAAGAAADARLRRDADQVVEVTDAASIAVALDLAG